MLEKTAVVDSGGYFTQNIFPWVLAANPADAFRLWNVAAAPDVALATGMAGVASGLPGWVPPASLVFWALAGFLLARAAFRRLEP